MTVYEFGPESTFCSQHLGTERMLDVLSVIPRGLTGLAPFNRLRVQVEGWTAEQWRSHFEKQIAPSRTSDPKWSQVLQNWIEQAPRHADLATSGLSLAVRLGGVRVFVCNPQLGKALEVLRSFWYFWILEPEEIEQVVGRSRWIWRREWNPDDRLASDLALYPLYVLEQTLWDFGERPISGQLADEIAIAVISDFRATHSGEPMRKAEFVTEVMSQDPRIHREWALTLWRKHAPADWRRSGPKRPRTAPPH